MSDWMIIGAVLAGTVVTSAIFWLVLMPRLAARADSKGVRIALAVSFGLVLLGIPAAGFALLAERTVPTICALLIGWGMTVRASAWFAARKYFVPRLKAMQRR